MPTVARGVAARTGRVNAPHHPALAGVLGARPRSGIAGPTCDEGRIPAGMRPSILCPEGDLNPHALYGH